MMRKKEKIAALILAAGYSSRMGNFKPLLPLNGHSVIEHVVANFRTAGITDIRVVVGFRANDLLPVLRGLAVKPVINNRYAEGMFSSVVAGFQTLYADEVEGALLLPVDTPLVKSRSLTEILKAYNQCDCGVIYPCFNGLHGHPPLIARKCFSTIINWNHPGGLRAVLQEFRTDIREVDVVDQTVMMDMDTPDDYQRIIAYLARQDIPTAEECEALFWHLRTPVKVVRHGEAVAETAVIMAEHLNKNGYKLDEKLVKTGGLLHDIGKGSSDHAAAGADILTQLGYLPVAEIVRRHMDLGTMTGLDEAAVVYLADKLVAGDQLVPLSRRFAGARDRFAGQPEILSLVDRRLATARLIKQKVEDVLGLSDIGEILPKGGIAHGDGLY